ISEIDSRFDVTSTATITQRWGISPTVTMAVETFAYEHEDFAAHIMMTETRKILDESFTDWVNQGSDAPSLLFARETHYLSVNLDENADVATESDLPDGNGKLLTMSIGEAKEETGVYLNWAPYRYRNAEWESYPIDEYWDKMEVRLKGIFDDSDEDTRRGQLKMAQSFYAALFVGQAALVQVGVDITGNFEAQESDADLTSGIGVGFSGGGIARLTKAYAGTWKKLFGVYFTLKDAKHPLQNEKKALKLRKDAYTAGAQAVATFTILALYAVADATGAEWLTDTLNGVGVVWGTYDAVVLGYTMYSAYKGSADALAKLSAGPTTLGMQLLGIGFLISQITMWGLFFTDMHNSGAKPGSLAYNYAASIQIAATITAIVWIGFGLLPGIGQIMTFLGLFEGLLGFICGLTDSDNPICMRLTGFLTMGFQWWLYSSNLMLDLGDADRFQLGSFDQKFKDPTKAMAVGNSLVVRGTVTNTISYIDKLDIQGWHGQAYKWQYNVDNLRSSTFEYEMSPSPGGDIHEDLDRGDMSREWEGADCRDLGFDARCTIAEDLDTESPVTQAGINRPTALYLSEGYAVPVQECWGIGIAPLIFPVCYVRTEKGTSPMNLSGMLRYDAFPATLDQFCALNWSRGTYPTFHTQADHDGDGLLSRSYPHRGPDPNDRDWDSDDDRVSDFFELQWGSNAQDFDSDNDGLSDRQEALLDTDPYRADTDYDGLLDSEEVFHQDLTTGDWSGGWAFVYDFAEDGSQLTAWVTSDPLTIDGDNDGWSDFQEKTYGFHPRVPSQKGILTLESNVREEDAPLLLLRLDETDGATTFRDDSGYGNSAACEGDTCPAAGHHGRYGNAADFDGVDDYLGIEVDVSETDYTLALWFKTTSTNRGIFSADDGELGSAGNDRHLYLNVGGDLCARVWNDETICTAGTNYADGEWHHVAHVFGGSVGGQKLYVGGIQKASGAKSSSDFTAQTGINIGYSNDAGNRYFDGLLDEVVLFDAALSQEEVEVLMAGRYNTADLIVKPGDVLYYKATVANELRGRYAQGLLSTDFPGAVSGEIPPKAFVLHPEEEETLEGDVTISDGAASGDYRLTQEADAMITDWREASDYAEMLLHFSEEVTTTTTFHDSSGNSPPRDGSCQSPRCPDSTVGPFGNALEFDGADDYVDASDVVGYVSGLSFSYGGWVYPSSAMGSLGAVFVFNAGGKDRTAVYYHPAMDKFEHCTETGGGVACAYGSHAFEPDQWHHLMVTVDRDGQGYVYVNGVEDLSFSPKGVEESDRFEIGRKWHSPGVGQHFEGRVDEVVVYNKALSPHQVQEQFAKPVFDMPLDESPGATVFEDESGFDNNATCSSGNCPEAGADGVSGSAASFDGDDFLPVSDSSALDLDDGHFTLSTWVAPEGQAPASSCPWRAEYYEYWYDEDDSRYVTDPFEGRTPKLVRCEDEIDQNWGSGGPAGMTSNFGVRWIGRLNLKRGWNQYHVVTDDGYKLYVGGTRVDKRWWEGGHNQTIDRWSGGGPTTIQLDYFERWGSAKAKLEISPDRWGDGQGILGADDYPVIQRVNGNHLRMVLNYGGGEVRYTTDDDVLTPGEWSHVVVTFDGNTLTLFVDGSYVGEVATSERSSGRGFDIGRGTGTRQLELQDLIVQDGGDTNSGGDSNLELYLQLKEGDGAWETLW
ncbi:MAG: LamG domain-containing protein, partial [Anaerolineae bacterium]